MQDKDTEKPEKITATVIDQRFKDEDVKKLKRACGIEPHPELLARLRKNPGTEELIKICAEAKENKDKGMLALAVDLFEKNTNVACEEITLVIDLCAGRGDFPKLWEKVIRHDQCPDMWLWIAFEKQFRNKHLENFYLANLALMTLLSRENTEPIQPRDEDSLWKIWRKAPTASPAKAQAARMIEHRSKKMFKLAGLNIPALREVCRRSLSDSPTKQKAERWITVVCSRMLFKAKTLEQYWAIRIAAGNKKMGPWEIATKHIDHLCDEALKKTTTRKELRKILSETPCENKQLQKKIFEKILRSGQVTHLDCRDARRLCGNSELVRLLESKNDEIILKKLAGVKTYWNAKHLAKHAQGKEAMNAALRKYVELKLAYEKNPPF